MHYNTNMHTKDTILGHIHSDRTPQDSTYLQLGLMISIIITSCHI